jgi:hypothetical protein
LNKAATIIAAAIVLRILVNSSNNQPEVAEYNKSANSTDFMLPRFVLMSGLSAELVRDIRKEVCGGIGQEDWVPQEVFFAYLEPRDAMFRIPCGQGQSGHFFRTFYISGSVPTIIDEYHPNAQLLFDVASKEQAAEYVIYFSVVLAGEMSNKQFVITEDQYDEWAEQCNANDTSVAKRLTITESREDYIVDLNFIDRVSGSFEHRQYRVTRDGAITLLDEKSLGYCGIVI